VPAVEAVNVEEHVAVAPVPDRVHVVNVPVTPVSAIVTVPDGVIAVPGEVSVTVTLQVEPWLITTGEVQLTVVEVARRLTVSDIVAEPLPALFVAVTLTVKVPVFAYV
jgi:hypothetical protein